MTIINTNPPVDEPEFYSYFDVILNPPDPFGYLGDEDFIYVEMYTHNLDNERRLQQQLEKVLLYL